MRPILLFALLAAPALATADAAIEKPVVAQTLEKFEGEAATVRSGMESGGIYGYIGENDRQRVEQDLQAMHKLLADHVAERALSQADKVTLLNTQEHLNALLLQNDNNRLECEQGARTGSRIKVTSCRTHGEIMRRQHQDQGTLSDIQRQPQTQLPSKDH